LDFITESYGLPPDFSKRIKSLRQKFGLSQQQFADLVDIFVPLLKRWERGQM
jgi:DNA-binding transcriptional regulator YiaG